ncbi:flagellar hook-basal body complex protein FliE [Sphingomonas quercus]|uniref:Flagellar hook-basal body complex protein FliE n=1 Tax=Sphingomonas quercus TaxID=2842451 RepID=A0ABS6BN46_9SPHN|nr:flagellar hook-basal body complex protein FliE [Sphingomonas quercus]MBU3078610.1 flagellar hook-basal body complex protein FliE [Sphingomonas quercus]
MSIGAFDATAAYSRAMNTMPSFGLGADDAPAAASGAQAAAGGGFAGMIESMVGQTAQSLHTAEAEGAKQVAGKGDLINVVTAVGAAEHALDTVVAVRDKIVSAYTEIMHMQI